MVLKVVLRLVPTKVNAAIAATAINAAISALLDRRDARLIVDEL
jgi:hypothetical protein